VGAALRVEPGGRLVEEDDPRLVDDAERDVDPPPLTTAVRLALAVGVLGELERLERAGRAALRLGLADAVHPGLEHQLLPGGRVVPRAAALGDVADAPAHLARVAPQVHTRDGGVAAVRVDQRGEDPQGRGLAGAVGAEETEDLPLGDEQVDPPDGVHALDFPAPPGPEGLA
jgi:hypothetical protein